MHISFIILKPLLYHLFSLRILKYYLYHGGLGTYFHHGIYLVTYLGLKTFILNRFTKIILNVVFYIYCKNHTTLTIERVFLDSAQKLSSPSPSPKTQIQVPNLKSKVQRKWNGTGADTKILQAA